MRQGNGRHGARHGRRPRWGQHFLASRAVAEAIAAAAAPDPGARLIEIGPGRGALTSLLAARAERVVAVEIDADLAARLPALPGLEIVVADAVEADWSGLLERALEGAGTGARVVLVGNLPYGVATPILLRYLAMSASDPRLGGAVVMVQWEVAERLLGRAGTKTQGSLGVLAQSTHAVRRILDVAPGSFRPPPRVRSAVVGLEPLASPLFQPADRTAHAAFIQAAFAHRRKQLPVALAGLLGLSREAWRDILVAAGHAPAARAEDLSATEIVSLFAEGRHRAARRV